MSGTLVYIMGPSGSGKDSLIAYARSRMSLPYAQTWSTSAYARRTLRPMFFVRRYITRPVCGGAERHHFLTREEFQFRQNKGRFALSWESHGLLYGIGNEIDAQLADGAVVVVNGSREYVREAIAQYPSLMPVLISAQPEVLRARLEQRRRENAAGIRERLAGAAMPLPDIPGLIRVDNSGALEEAGRIFSDLFLRWRDALTP